MSIKPSTLNSIVRTEILAESFRYCSDPNEDTMSKTQYADEKLNAMSNDVFLDKLSSALETLLDSRKN